MLKQINFSTNGGLKYIMLYDDEYLTEKQALVECEFVGWGGGHDYTLFPHYVIIDEEKRPILKCIKEFILNEYGGNKDDL
jgi:hypothetical protein